MAQVSYGTITITDTNDIESITIEYARNQSTTTPPASSSSDWSTTRPAWAQGYYIWQRTRIHKTGEASTEDTFGDAVCLTGSTGQTGTSVTISSIKYAISTTESQPADSSFTYTSVPTVNEGQWLWTLTTYSNGSKMYTKSKQGESGDVGQSLTATKTQYTHVASNVTITTSNHTSYTWTDNVPEYDSTKPVYWGRITNTYSNPSKTEYIVYKDNGLTEAIAKSVEANTNASEALDKANEAESIATHANEDAQGALSQAAAAQYQAEALDAKLKAFFWPGDSNYTGAYAVSGIDGTTLNPSSISTYGFNVAIRPAAVSIGYNAIKALELDGATPSLKFYVPSKTTQATNPSMELKSSALTFYKIGTANKTLEVSSNGISLYGSSAFTADATLTSSGLELIKGGIKAGTRGQSGYIYLSTENHPTGSNGVTINNFTPTNNTEQWREVIGTKFGVTNAGTLYASNVNISGNITASSLKIGSNASVEGLSTENITGMDAYSTTSEIETYVSNQGYQTASDVSSTISTEIGNTSVSDLSDGSNYSTTSAMNSAISNATNDMATQTYVSNTYATKTALTTEINQRKAQYGTCETTYNTRDKVVTCDSFELVAGNEIMVYFHNSNNNAYNTYTTYSIRLNVNNKGLKDVWVAGAVTSSTNQLLWADGAYITFKYDGSKFIVIGEPRSWYGASTIGEGVASKTDTTAITGCVICKGTKIELAMSKRNTNSSPTLNIRSTGAKSIYYGNTEIGPTVTNGHSWLDSSTATFTFDGQYYRMAGQTFINGDSITTGTISANRIDVAGIISANGIVTDTLTGGTINTSDYIRVSTQDLTSGIPVGTSETKTDWRIIAGTKFGVDKEGYTWASELILGNGITGTTLAQTSALVDQYEKVLTVTEQTDSNLVYENLSIHQYQGSENTVDENSQSISYIQTQLNFNSNRMTFTQNIIDNMSPDANTTIEVAHIDATNDGIFYIEKLKPTSIIFGELELIEYNKGLGIRRRS